MQILTQLYCALKGTGSTVCRSAGQLSSPRHHHRHVRFLLHPHGHLHMEQCPREKPMFWISQSFPVFPPLSCYQDPPCSCQSDGSAGVFSRTGRHRKDESQKTAERKVPGRKAWSILGLGTDSTGWLKSTFTTIHHIPERTSSLPASTAHAVNGAATQAAHSTSVSQIHYKERKLGMVVLITDPSALEAETSRSLGV